MSNPFNNPALQNAFSGATMSTQNRSRMNAQLATAGNTEAQRRQRENQQRRSNQIVSLARIVSQSGRLPSSNRERLALSSRALQKALRPNIEQNFGRHYFGYSGIANVNTINAIFRRLRSATNVPSLLTTLNRESVTLNYNQGNITKKRLLRTEINSGIYDLVHRMNMMETYSRNVSPAVKSKIIRAFVARYGNLTPNNVKLIVPNVSNHILSVYRKLRKYIKGDFRTSRRQNGKPAVRAGLGPKTERRIRKVKGSSSSRR